MTTCSNPSRPKRAIVRRVAVGATAVGLALAPVLVASPASAAAFGTGNVVVCRVGSGTSALTNSATEVFLDEFTPTGTFVQSIAMPTTPSGANKALTASGTATSECLITRSTDGQFLVVTGYSAAVGTASIAGTASATTPRVIARVDSTGAIDSSTALTDFSTANNPRSATSVDGSAFWAVGGAGGPRYATLGSSTSTQISASLTNLRQANIFGNQLYGSDSSGSTFRLSTIGTGLPTTSGQIMTNLPGFPTATGSPYAFFFADLSSTVAGLDTLYVADDTGTTGGVQKYSLVGSTWTSNGTIVLTSARGLTGVQTGNSVTLFVTTNGAGLSKLTDTAGYNVANNGTSAAIATAATNTAFRGVALAPVNVPTPIVPEVPLAVVLPVSMLLALGGFVLTRHRPSLRVAA